MFAKDNCTNIPLIVWSGAERGYYGLVMPDLRKITDHVRENFNFVQILASVTVFAVDMVRPNTSPYYPILRKTLGRLLLSVIFILKTLSTVTSDPTTFCLGVLTDGLPGVVLIDFETAVKTGETRVGEAQYEGDVYFASLRALLDRKCT